MIPKPKCKTDNPIETTVGKQRRGFQPGQSGNPAGRPKGARNKTTLAIEALLDGEAEAISRKAIALAKDGDMTAIRLCMDRIVPPRKDRPVPFPMPKMESAADAVKASAAVIAAVAEGELTLSEAAELTTMVEVFARTIEVADLEKRLIALELAATRNAP